MQKLIDTGKHSLMVLAFFIPLATNANDVAVFLDTLSPNALVAEVLKRNPAITHKQAQITTHLTRAEQAGALADPVLSYSVAPNTYNQPDQDFGQKVTLSQHLPWPGKRDLARRAHVHQSEAATAQVNTERLMLTTAAKNAFADWYFAHAAININARNKALWKEFQHIAEFNYSTGKSGKQDVLKAEVEYYRLKHRDITLDHKRKAARNQINALLNLDPNTPLPPPQKITQISSPATVDQLIIAALQIRPELDTLNEQIAAAQRQLELTDMDDYPDFKLMAGWNSLWDDEDKRWTVGISMNLPLNSGKHRGAKGEAQARIERLEASRDQLTTLIKTQVQDAFDAVEEARHTLKLYHQHLLPIATDNLTASRRDYESGSGDFLSMESAEKNLMQTELESEKALTSLYRNMAELDQATASTLLGQPAPETAPHTRGNT